MYRNEGLMLDVIACPPGYFCSSETTEGGEPILLRQCPEGSEIVLYEEEEDYSQFAVCSSFSREDEAETGLNIGVTIMVPILQDDSRLDDFFIDDLLWNVENTSITDMDITFQEFLSLDVVPLAQNVDGTFLCPFSNNKEYSTIVQITNGTLLIIELSVCGNNNNKSSNHVASVFTVDSYLQGELCSPGTVYAPGFPCAPCPMGYYCNGRQDPIPCANNTYGPFTGLSSCYPCPIGLDDCSIELEQIPIPAPRAASIPEILLSDNTSIPEKLALFHQWLSDFYGVLPNDIVWLSGEQGNMLNDLSFLCLDYT